MDGTPSIGGFEILERIGAGGQAVVYRATQQSLGRTVALKIFQSPAIDQTALRRFTDECRAAGVVRHPRIVHVYDAGVDGHLPWISMELLEGGSAADRMEQDGPMDWRQAGAVGLAMAEALASAHGSHVLHRDVKPGNILFDRDGRAYLSDFGVARLLEATTGHSVSVGMVGTVAYMAPELLNGPGEPSVRSDLYSLGGTLFALLTGRAPYVRDTDSRDLQIAYRAVNDPVPDDLRSLDLPPALVDLVERCLAKDPQERPASAAEVADVLRALVGAGADPDDPELLRPGSPDSGSGKGPTRIGGPPERPGTGDTDAPGPPDGVTPPVVGPEPEPEPDTGAGPPITGAVPRSPSRRSRLLLAAAAAALALVAGVAIVVSRGGEVEAGEPTTGSSTTTTSTVPLITPNSTTTSSTSVEPTGTVPTLVTQTSAGTVTTNPPTTRPPAPTTAAPTPPALTVALSGSAYVNRQNPLGRWTVAASPAAIGGTWYDSCGTAIRPNWSPGDGYIVYAQEWNAAGLGPGRSCRLSLTVRDSTGRTAVASTTYRTCDSASAAYPCPSGY